MDHAIRPISDLRTTGLLWLINRTVFHPRGYALGITPDGDGWQMLGDGSEPWTFAEEQDQFEAVKTFFGGSECPDTSPS